MPEQFLISTWLVFDFHDKRLKKKQLDPSPSAKIKVANQIVSLFHRMHQMNIRNQKFLLEVSYLLNQQFVVENVYIVAVAIAIGT